MITHEIRDNPEKIWLEPGCSPERCWCENVLGDCEEPGCGAKAVGYVREDIVDHATREAARIADENARLRAALREIVSLDDEPKCCGKGIAGYDSPPECCGDPERGIDRAQSVARAALEGK